GPRIELRVHRGSATTPRAEGRPKGDALRRSSAPLGSDGFAAALYQHLADLLDHRLDLLQVGVYRQGPLEVLGGALQLPLLEVDQAEARERAEVDRVPPDHLLAVGQRPVVLADQVVQGRPLVPPLGEGRGPLDHVGEDVRRLRIASLLHQRDAALQERVDGGVSRALPDGPQGRLGAVPHLAVGIPQRLGQLARRRRAADAAQLAGGPPARGRPAAPEPRAASGLVRRGRRQRHEPERGQEWLHRRLRRAMTAAPRAPSPAVIAMIRPRWNANGWYRNSTSCSPAGTQSPRKSRLTWDMPTRSPST